MSYRVDIGTALVTVVCNEDDITCASFLLTDDTSLRAAKFNAQRAIAELLAADHMAIEIEELEEKQQLLRNQIDRRHTRAANIEQRWRDEHGHDAGAGA